MLERYNNFPLYNTVFIFQNKLWQEQERWSSEIVVSSRDFKYVVSVYHLFLNFTSLAANKINGTKNRNFLIFIQGPTRVRLFGFHSGPASIFPHLQTRFGRRYHPDYLRAVYAVLSSKRLTFDVFNHASDIDYQYSE